MSHCKTYARIDLDAVDKNIAGVRQRIPAKTKILAVIKADAYGHGACVLADFLEDKVEYFGVSSVDEALELRCHGIKKPVLVLGTAFPEEFSSAVENDVALTVYRLADAEKLSEEAVRQNKTASVHIKVDTGMSRIGYQVNKASAEEVKKISFLPGIKITGVFSHYANADEKDKAASHRQSELFDSFLEMLEAAGVNPGIRHIDNSAGTMEPYKYYDMVRVGIMLYGLYPSQQMNKSYPLYPAMQLISRVSDVKMLEKGRRISYGGTCTLSRDTRVATVTAGYADGYPRSLSGGRGEVLVRGVRCPILGRICMDQMMIDADKVQGIQPGDEAVLVGTSRGETISAEAVADMAYSFNYELVCGISRRVPRVYIIKGREMKTVSYLQLPKMPKK